MNNLIIDLKSDTVTRPCKNMLDAMMTAIVGDDVFGEDPSINTLEEKAALMFGKEAAIFCPSGTMTNQIAIKVHTQPGDEVICDELAHIYNYEGGGIAFNSGASVRLIKGDRGRICAEDVERNINIDNIHYTRSRLVCVENTANKGGGSIYDFEELKKISEVCKENGLKYHLDGARIFNALVETGELPEKYGKIFDSVSICLSKGLGAPVGSLLLGNKSFINQAKRVRKVFGGGMRQAGYLAAAGIYALDNNINRLTEDHKRAKEIEKCLNDLHYIDYVNPVSTNIIIFKLSDKIKDSDFILYLSNKKIFVVGMGPQLIRIVTHLDFNDAMLERLLIELKTFGKN